MIYKGFSNSTPNRAAAAKTLLDFAKQAGDRQHNADHAQNQDGKTGRHQLNTNITPAATSTPVKLFLKILLKNLI